MNGDALHNSIVESVGILQTIFTVLGESALDWAFVDLLDEVRVRQRLVGTELE
jgi:hypothetical protein